MTTGRTKSFLDRSFAAVLFDMDGTLISSIDSAIRSWTRLGEEFAIPGERFLDLHGVPARGIIDLLMGDREPAERERALTRIVEIEVGDTDGIEVLPGTIEALALLVPAGRCAIVTSSTRELATARLRAARVQVPDVVVTADDVSRGKPDPEPFLVAAARLGVDAADCLVVEDAVTGVAAAHAAGALALALTTTEEITGDLVVGDLSAVRFSLLPDGVRVGLR